MYNNTHINNMLMLTQIDNALGLLKLGIERGVKVSKEWQIHETIRENAHTLPIPTGIHIQFTIFCPKTSKCVHRVGTPVLSA